MLTTGLILILTHKYKYLEIYKEEKAVIIIEVEDIEKETIKLRNKREGKQGRQNH